MGLIDVSVRTWTPAYFQMFGYGLQKEHLTLRTSPIRATSVARTVVSLSTLPTSATIQSPAWNFRLVVPPSASRNLTVRSCWYPGLPGLQDIADLVTCLTPLSSSPALPGVVHKANCCNILWEPLFRRASLCSCSDDRFPPTKLCSQEMLAKQKRE